MSAFSNIWIVPMPMKTNMLAPAIFKNENASRVITLYLLRWQSCRQKKKKKKTHTISNQGAQMSRDITLSFILQLCAKALEPSIFSECRFFMKASGSFQSFMSASSSSARPTAGEWSKSESIFIRALQGRAFVSPTFGFPAAAWWENITNWYILSLCFNAEHDYLWTKEICCTDLCHIWSHLKYLLQVAM